MACSGKIATWILRILSTIRREFDTGESKNYRILDAAVV